MPRYPLDDEEWILYPWLPKGLRVVTGWDLSISEGQSGDWMVGFTAGVDMSLNRYVLNIERYRGVPFAHKDPRKVTQLSLMKMSYNRFNPAVVVIESNVFQAIYEQVLAATTDIPVTPHSTSGQKADLIDGIPGFVILYEQQRYRIPRGDTKSEEMTDIWVTESELGGIGENDDIVMAQYMMEQGVKILKTLDSGKRRASAVPETARRGDQ